MFIQTEETPNPATVKFLPGRDVSPEKAFTFVEGDDLTFSPLAQRLLALEGVNGVFLGGDFISVTKGEDWHWSHLKPSVLGAIMDHFMSGAPVIQDGDDQEVVGADDDEVTAKIRSVIDTYIRPAVARDGGDVTLVGFEKGIVYLSMQGACAGCPSATMTLKHGIENMLRRQVPDVIEVRQA
ncbi:MAG: NifU family protein [Alphaproteobacteria bacterium]|nr:NifU family protein [Alphaproteobacteria bacterium]